ncbi:hypothetical protein [Nocardia sp. NPDC051832]|uniref:hypothetical protein n=1 Tax=Nocardia sp. NPDC051832 TaxID=3155673 RepID=UPI00342B8E2F
MTLSAITAVPQSNYQWKHLIPAGPDYAIFDDSRVVESGKIGAFDTATQKAGKWNAILPETFWRDITAAAVVYVPASEATDGAVSSLKHWAYLFVKGGDTILFRDDAILVCYTNTGTLHSGHVSIAERWPHVHAWLDGATITDLDAVLGTSGAWNDWKYLAVTGSRYAIYSDTKLIESGQIDKKWPFLPSAFRAGPDTVAIAVEPNGVWKYLFTKGNDLIYFTDAGIAAGPLPISKKWPHVDQWLTAR